MHQLLFRHSPELSDTPNRRLQPQSSHAPSCCLFPNLRRCPHFRPAFRGDPPRISVSGGAGQWSCCKHGCRQQRLYSPQSQVPFPQQDLPIPPSLLSPSIESRRQHGRAHLLLAARPQARRAGPGTQSSCCMRRMRRVTARTGVAATASTDCMAEATSGSP